MNALADGAFPLEQPGLSISANGSPVVHNGRISFQRKIDLDREKCGDLIAPARTR